MAKTDRKHVCIYNKPCWCGAGAETRVLHNRVVVGGVGGKSGWPMKMESVGVHPAQAAEEAENYRKCGVPTDFKDGCPVATSRAHYLKILKLNKMHERSQVLSGRPCA